MKRKIFALVSVGMDEGNQLVGAVWTGPYGKPHEYMIRLFESRAVAQTWAEKAHPNDTVALFDMICFNPTKPPAPAEPPAEPEQASEEESEQSNVEP